MIQLIKKWEDIDYVLVPASTAVAVGDSLKYNGSGQAIPGTSGVALLGIALQAITSTDPDYASAKQIAYQKTRGAGEYNFLMNVTVGALTVAQVGLPFNVSTPGNLDVSGAGTQFRIVRVIKTTTDGSVTPGLVEVTCILPA